MNIEIEEKIYNRYLCLFLIFYFLTGCRDGIDNAINSLQLELANKPPEVYRIPYISSLFFNDSEAFTGVPLSLEVEVCGNDGDVFTIELASLYGASFDFPDSSLLTIDPSLCAALQFFYIPKGDKAYLDIIEIKLNNSSGLQDIFEYEIPIMAEGIVIADLNVDFQLNVKQVARIASSDINIIFREVAEDSRCPEDVSCIWEGKASILVDIVRNNREVDKISLTIPKNSIDGNIYIIDDLLIKVINLSPASKSDKLILQSDYKATFVVMKTSLFNLSKLDISFKMKNFLYEEVASFNYGDIVTLELTVGNTTDSEQVIGFSDGQLYDFIVSDVETDKIVWKWSSGMSFAQSQMEKTIEPNGVLIFKINWDQKNIPIEGGRYKAKGLIKNSFVNNDFPEINFTIMNE